MKTLVLAAALALPMIASAEQPTTTKPAQTEKTGKLTPDEVNIIAHVHHVNQMEITMGKEAKAKGTPAVKRYGDMLVKDHTTSDKELTALAKKKGLAKIPADQPTTEDEKLEAQKQHAAMADLKKLKGADFDREFLQLMVDGHEKEIAKTDQYLASIQDPDLKTMMEARKTTLQRHEDAAKELQKGNAQASTTTPSKSTAAAPRK